MRGGQILSIFCHFGKSLISQPDSLKEPVTILIPFSAPDVYCLARLMLACFLPALHAIHLCFVDCKLSEVDRFCLIPLYFFPPSVPSRFIKCLSMIKVDSHVGLTCEASGSFLTLVT